MNAYLLSALAILAAYLIGAIPFAYVLFYAVRRDDIRKYGSGNVGATNIGRQLGFRYFVFVFVLDVSKGLLPTLFFAPLVRQATGHPVPDLKVLIALATILGHNFPIYLRFRGGKGVATSLGALFGLDWVASTATLVGGTVLVLVTRYVSVASLGGGLFFLLVHFARTERPWSQEQRAMSALSVALVVMLFFRHRKNLQRIGDGTEPKVTLRKKPKDPEPTQSPRGCAGKTRWVLVAALALVGAGLAFGLSVLHTSHPATVVAGSVVVTEVARASTEHQRAERVAFSPGGDVLAVTCPRYDRVVLYRVTQGATLEPIKDVELGGRPVAIAAAGGLFYVLQAPPGDARHLEPGWFDAIDFEGHKVGSRSVTGFYPDDLVVAPDGRHVLVLTSGRAEGGPHRPPPALDVFELGDGATRALPVGHLTFNEPKDDPARLTLSTSGHCAAVTLWGSNEVASVDVFDMSRPALVGRSPLIEAEVPYASLTSGDAILMPVDSHSEAVWATVSTAAGTPVEKFVVCTLPHGSGLRLYHGETGRLLGNLTLRGPLNLGRIRPTGLAFSPERGLIALANRSGGVHLIALRPRDDLTVPATGLATADPVMPGR